MGLIDHYSYWYNKDQENALLPREIKTIKLIDNANISKNTKFLDIGCGVGKFLKYVEKRHNIKCYGVEYSKKAIKICKQKGIKIKYGNIEKKSLIKITSLTWFMPEKS